MHFTRTLGTCRAAVRWLPSQCMICRAWPSQPVCTTCIARFAPTLARCTSCAARVPEGASRCAKCLGEPNGLDHCVAAVDYAWPWADLVTALKFNARPGIAATLAHILRKTEGAKELLQDCDAIVPVPLAPQRLRERGYNQSLLLARGLGHTKLHHAWLQRTHETLVQSHLDRPQRLHNLLGAFSVPTHAHAQLTGAHVLLVDDVMTTGATLHAATAALREGGAAYVSALAFARTP